MANEITLSVKLASSKGGSAVSQTLSKTADMAGNENGQETQIIGTSAEALTFGESSGSSGPFLALLNMDATNYVEIAMDNTVSTPFCKLKAGEVALIPMSAAAVYAKANTASVRVLKVFSDR